MVLSDLNDGLGLDEYENLFGHSSVEIILGEIGCPCLYDPHAARALARKIDWEPTTSRFFLKKDNRYLQVLLDYIMVRNFFVLKQRLGVFDIFLTILGVGRI